ncbi:MAG: hypothetical protein OXP71_03315 [Candidatus Poribacteria bacterium]|nr:hypothetical protein [Candidatus Poribacteria bacterium]
MNVTFDSNVWEKVVGNAVSHYAKIKDKIRTGVIHPYICEIALSLEAIQNKLRTEFFEKYEPSIKFRVVPTEDSKLNMGVSFKPNEELHPGFHPRLKAKLLEAQDLGFRVLRMTRFGTVRPKNIPPAMYVDYGNEDEFWKYADLQARCSEYIVTLGCGQAAYNQLKERFNLVKPVNKGIPSEFEKKFQEVIAEWVDGDLLSAHYASGNEWFCTDDKAGNAGIGSVFHSQNKVQVEKKFGIKIISSYDAARLKHSN